jgi:hypothetical protein
MLTFDADDTLFPGGCSLSEDDWIVDAILTFLRKGLAQWFCCCNMLSALLQAYFHRTFAITVGCNSVCPLQPAGLMVAVVTAAGYPGADGARKFVPAPPPNFVLDYDSPSRYEARLRGLLDAMISQGMDAKTTRRFFVLGGECNYLCQCNSGVLEPIEFNSLHFIFEPTENSYMQRNSGTTIGPLQR